MKRERRLDWSYFDRLLLCIEDGRVGAFLLVGRPGVEVLSWAYVIL